MDNEIIIDNHGEKHIIAERGEDYVIFRHEDGSRYVTTLLSGNVPKGFFDKKDKKGEGGANVR